MTGQLRAEIPDCYVDIASPQNFRSAKSAWSSQWIGENIDFLFKILWGFTTAVLCLFPKCALYKRTIFITRVRELRAQSSFSYPLNQVSFRLFETRLAVTIGSWHKSASGKLMQTTKTYGPSQQSSNSALSKHHKTTTMRWKHHWTSPKNNRTELYTPSISHSHAHTIRKLSVPTTSPSPVHIDLFFPSSLAICCRIGSAKISGSLPEKLTWIVRCSIGLFRI